MPPAKTKSAPNGGQKGKVSSTAASTNGTTTPVSTVEKKDTSDPLASLAAGGKPDKKLYDLEQDRIKTEIDALQAKLSVVRDKISLTTKSGNGNDRRAALRAELDSIRGQQSTNKASRSKILDQVKAIQDGIQKKVKDIQTAKSKTPWKTVAEVDAHIKNLEKQIESGNMKLADEKRALQELSTCKRNRRAVEGFQADQESIEADRHTVDELRKQLDDPESRAVSERYDAIKAELDKLKKEGDEAYEGRSKLFDERDNIQNQLTALYNEKRESAQHFRESNDQYWTKINEDRARRAERARAQRVAEETQKKQEIAERLLEEATAPAYQLEIEDCQTLIGYFSGENATNPSTPLHTRPDVAGVPKLELRQVEAPAEGLIVHKKKGEEDAYFIGGKGKGKGKKGTANGNVAATTANATLNIPLHTLSGLLKLSIPPPVSNADIPRVIEDLRTKKTWYEANQARVTAENVAKAEAEINRLTVKDAKPEPTPPSGGSEIPAEPASTLKIGDVPSTPAASSEVVDGLEVAGEQEAVEES